MIEGPVAVLDALEAGMEIREVFIGEQADPVVAATAGGRGVPVVEVGPRVLAALTETVTPQGVVAVAKLESASLSDVSGTGLVIVLDQVRDPGNAGTLIRSALAAGAGGAVFTGGSVDPWNSKTLRAAAGAAFRLPLVVDVTFAEVADVLRSEGMRLVAASAEADRPYYEIDLARPCAVIVGNEAWGFPSTHLGSVDEIVGIPMPGPVESLNVAVAGALILFEAVRQRGGGAPVYPRRSDV